MVQILLGRGKRRWLSAALVAASAAGLCAPVYAAAAAKESAPPPEAWELSLDGGRTLTWEHSFSSEKEVKPNRSFWVKVIDFVAGAPELRFLIRPFSVVTDSHGRVIVTDPGAEGVHIFDFEQHKYRFIDRHTKSKDAMLAPQCVAVDAEDNIYVTDSNAGTIFEFEPNGKFVRSIGSIKGGEGYFKRPTGIAVDSAAQRIYVTDTLRDKVFVLDWQGNIVQTIGKRGEGPGEFNLPTELRLNGQDLIVVDAMNFRIQVFDRTGSFKYSIGKLGDSPGAMFRPKGAGVDSEGHLYVVDSLWGLVQVFDRQGQLLYYFGEKGTHAGQFQLPTGLFIDRQDRVYVVDSFNRRVQIFQYIGVKDPEREALK